MVGTINGKLAAIYLAAARQDDAAVTAHIAGLVMPEFRISKDGKHSYRLIKEVYDDFRNAIWVLVERDGVLLPDVLSMDRWKSMQRDLPGAPVGCA